MIQLPIVVPDPSLKSSLTATAGVGVSGQDVDMQALNETVYELYGLSNDETNLIADWFQRRSLIEVSTMESTEIMLTQTDIRPIANDGETGTMRQHLLDALGRTHP